MANRRFEMHEFRQIIQRLRLGESDRQIPPWRIGRASTGTQAAKSRSLRRRSQ